MSADNLLLVVDVQEQAMHFSSRKTKLLERINRVIKKFEENNDPVIYVKQENLGDFSSKLKVESSAPVFTKNEPSPFTQTNFAQKVHDLNPKNVVVVGLMNHACVQATVKSALSRDYSVTLISDGYDSSIKPVTNHYNHLLTKLGAHRLTTDEFLLVQ